MLEMISNSTRLYSPVMLNQEWPRVGRLLFTVICSTVGTILNGFFVASFFVEITLRRIESCVSKARKKKIMSKDDRDVVNLDRILVEEVGQCGIYQLRAVALCALVAILSGLGAYSYLFTFDKSRTRCVISECENENSSTTLTFAPPWILDAVPASGNSFDQCHRFPSISSTSSNTSESCPANAFNKNSSIVCEEYVYEHNHSAYYEFNLACDSWRPTLIGSAGTLGYLLCLPMTGFVSDRWGRSITLTLTAFNTAWIGCLEYFANSYNIYIIISFVGSLFGATLFASAYILAVEYVGPKHRVATGVAMSTFLCIGETLLGLIAWYGHYWRNLVLIVSAPQLIFVLYFWIAPESVRWLMSKGRYEESLKILKKAAETNGNALSEKTLKGFLEIKHDTLKENDKSNTWLVCLVFKHKPVLVRCLVTPIWWLTTIMLYYGLTISSVGISGNKYLNYSATTAIQMPGYWIALFLLNKIGRKPLLITEFWLCAACQFAYIFISKGHYWLSLSIYLIGKMCISSVVTSIYVYTAELYPTQHRTSLFAFSSMVGRVGGILAPLMPGLAAEVWVNLPFVIFGCLALLSGILVMLAPETLGTTLPDTMEEAASLGKDSPSMLQWLRTLVFRSKSYNMK